MLFRSTTSRTAWRTGHPVGLAAAAAGLGAADQLSQVNVAITLERLGRVLGERPVRLVGLWFDVEDASLRLLDGDRFVPLTDAELAALAHLGAPQPVG